MTDWTSARANMVTGQVLTGNVHGRRLLDAIGAIPRERFVPATSEALAYSDVEIPLPVAAGDPQRSLLTPLTLGRLIGLANVASTDLVLDIGCATGYSSAVLARLAASVVALEEDDALAGRAAETLADLDVDNVAVVTGRLADGYSPEAPYDIILVNGAVDSVPSALFDQLGDRGRLICIVGSDPVGQATEFLNEHGHISGRPSFDATASPLPGLQREPGFAF